MQSLTPYEKKQYLLQKYAKRDYKIEDLEPKYAVYFNPSIEMVKEWTLISVCSTIEEAKHEILFRKKYIETGDGDLVLDNDPRFSSFRNETIRNIEPTDEMMNIDYNSSGNMLQVISNSLPEQQSNQGFKGLCYYTQFDLNEYKGTYKIEEIYQI